MKFKFMFSIIVVSLSFLLVSGIALADANPVPIGSLEDLMNINKSENLSKNYILIADIDVGFQETDDLKFVPIGILESSALSFKGNFNGNGHTISNITFSDTWKDGVGLFGYTENAVISNVSLENVNLVGKHYVGAVVGRANNSEIMNCSVSNSDGFSIRGNNHVGGLVGYQEYSSVSDSNVAGNVKGKDNVGGLIGSSSYSNVSESYAVSIVEGVDHIGGLIGSTSYSNISESYSTSDVEGDSSIGGLVGSLFWSNVSESYATGTAKSTSTHGNFIGGLIGNAGSSSSVSDSYATGNVEG